MSPPNTPMTIVSERAPDEIEGTTNLTTTEVSLLLRLAIAAVASAESVVSLQFFTLLKN